MGLGRVKSICLFRFRTKLIQSLKRHPRCKQPRRCRKTVYLFLQGGQGFVCLATGFDSQGEYRFLAAKFLFRGSLEEVSNKRLICTEFESSFLCLLSSLLNWQFSEDTSLERGERSTGYVFRPCICSLTTRPPCISGVFKNYSVHSIGVLGLSELSRSICIAAFVSQHHRMCDEGKALNQSQNQAVESTPVDPHLKKL